MTRRLFFVAALAAVVLIALRSSSPWQPEVTRAEAATPTVSLDAQEAPPKLTITTGNSRRVQVGSRSFPRTGAPAGLRQDSISGAPWIENYPGFRALSVRVTPRSQVTTFGVKESGEKEGLLTRLHIDASLPNTTVVIGFYENVATDEAVGSSQTIACKKCGSVIVCGVEPNCF